MPIPQFKNSRPTGSQGWRASQQKKYYITNRKPLLSNRGSSGRSGGFNRGKKIISAELKKKLFKITIFLMLAGIIFLLITFFWVNRDLPDPGQLIDREVAQSTKIYDRTGEKVLYEIHGDQQRTLVKLNEIPAYVPQATIAIEDKDFYKHKGISLWGILRGVIWKPLTGQRAQGGSTLTQQFVKNAILTSERKITRKLKEWILAYKIEQTYTKEEILQMYFNEIPYGSTSYGVQAASQRFFGKSAQNLSLAEAAILAALPQAPSKYSPYGPNKDLLISRQKYILDLMVEQGYISAEDADIAKGTEIEFKKPEENIQAPHFVMYVKELLAEKYGEKTVEQGGLKIITTLDLYKQKIAEEVITERTEKNTDTYNATNAALVSIDPKTGQVLAMVGSRDYFNDEIDGQFNVSTASRQPGSSLKPLVYTAAFLKGYTPNTILYDVTTNFSTDPGKPYEPHNYDGAEHGPISMRQALAGSLNTPAVKAIYLAGIDNVLDLARDFGYTTLNDRDRFGLSLVLGGGEVKLLEHTNAYGVFAREGLLHPINVILKVEDADGKVLEEFKENEKRVLDPKIARMTTSILSDNSARAYVFGAKNWLTLDSRPVAAKTGTTNDYRDAWTMGYTPSLVTGVWVGNSDNTEMKRGADGSVVAAPIWHDYMQRVLGDTPVESFRPAEIPKTGKFMLDGEINNGQIVKIDKSSGLLATEYTPAHLIEEKNFFKPHCILYYVDKNNPLGDAPGDPGSDPQFNLWESRVQAWFEKQKASSTSKFSTEQPPTESDNVHRPENLPELEILSPSNNQAILDPVLSVDVKTSAPRGIRKVEYSIDDNLMSVNSNSPFNLNKAVNFLSNGFHNLKVTACDDVDNCTTKELEFNLILEESHVDTSFSVSLSSPADNSTISASDFPLNFNARIENPTMVARVIFYAVNDNRESEQIASNQMISVNDIANVWVNPPAGGTYKLYAEAVGWNKKKVTSQEIILIINEPENKTE